MGWNIFRKDILGLKILVFIFIFLYRVYSEDDPKSMFLEGRPLRKEEIAEDFEAQRKLENHVHERYFHFDFEFTNELSSYIIELSTISNLKYINYFYRKSDLFRSFIYKKIQDKNLPLELFFIPMVETNYNPRAISRVKAVGMWQFMLNSIDPWLKYNSLIDERMDFVLSTEAALEKLYYNYQKLGDWLLAIAAYNAGLYKIQNMIQNNGGIRDFWYYYRKNIFPRQTKEYVLKFLAYAYIGGYLGRYGFELDWDARDWDILTVDSSINIYLLQKFANIKDGSLVLANAKYKNGVTLQNEKNEIKFLSKDKEKILATLEKDYDKVRGFWVYKVTAKDTLYEIAKKNGIALNDLENYNPEINPRKLKIGNSIKIPYSDKGKPEYYEVKSGLSAPIFEADLNDTNGNLYKEDVYSDVLHIKENSIQYVVGKNETLSQIALKYNLTVEFLMFWNAKKNNSILEGEIIKIPKF